MLSIIEFQHRFPNEEACFEYLYNKKWPNGFVCPRCSHSEAYRVKTRKLLQCKKCRHQTSVTAGTIFHKLRQPLMVLIWTCYWIATSKKGISGKELQRKLGVSYQTAWTLGHKIRQAMKSSGKYQIINEAEFDETCLGEADKKFDKGRAIIKVVVQVNRENQRMGRAYLEHIQTENSKDVKEFINKTVAPGAIIRTDGKKTYHFLKVEYHHHPHKMYDKKDNDIHLPKVHIVIANLKMWLSGVHNHLPYKHSQRYLDEFCFRFNRRWRLDTIFDKLINRAVITPAITYAELTG
jgi:hypothetical protein